EDMIRLSAYASLHQSGDSISEVNQMRSGRGMMRFQKISKMMSFVSTELKEVPEEIIREAMSQNKDHALYLEETLEDRKYALSKEAEKVLINLSPVLNAPYGNYNRFKLADMKFNDFEIDGVTYPNSFTLFENEYEYEPNTKVRRTAYETFYAKLKEYQNGLASNYQTQLLKEKAMADIRGFKSVFDYLLHGQKVPRAFMDRQIDLIMENLAPYMRKYAKLLQKVNG